MRGKQGEISAPSATRERRRNQTVLNTWVDYWARALYEKRSRRRLARFGVAAASVVSWYGLNPDQGVGKKKSKKKTCKGGLLTCKIKKGKKKKTVCVDAENDPAHCGACNNSCPDGQRCAVGVCAEEQPCTPGVCTGCAPGTCGCMEATVNLQATVDAAPAGSVITLCPGTFRTNLRIARDLSIFGDGSGRTILDGGLSDSVVMIGVDATVALERLTLSRGKKIGTGGGIDNQGKLVMRQCQVTNNAATFRGGGIHNDATGRLKLEQCRVEDNAAAGGGVSRGGGIWNHGVLEIVESTVSRNTAVFDGGGVVNFGELTVLDSAIDTNRAGDPQQLTSGSGGGIYHVHPGVNPGASTPGLMVLKRSSVHGNSAHEGGGIHISGGDVTLENCEVDENEGAFGGGINVTGNLTLLHTSVVRNSAGQGGGITNNSHPAKPLANSVLTLDDGARVENNSARSSGGGIHNMDQLVLLSGSRVNGNTAEYQGGGIASVGHAKVTMHPDSQVSDNEAEAEGGGIFNDSGEVLLMAGCQVRDNITHVDGGGFYNRPRFESAAITVAASDIVTANTLTQEAGSVENNCAPVGTIENCIG